jgi:hypothetical protein
MTILIMQNYAIITSTLTGVDQIGFLIAKNREIGTQRRKGDM